MTKNEEGEEAEENRVEEEKKAVMATIFYTQN